MSHSQVGRILLTVAVLGAGLWLVFAGSPGPAPESAARQQALQALAPASADQAAAPAAISGEKVTPVTVSLADVPAGVYDPNNQYDRWQRGEIDLDEREAIVSEAEMAAMQEASLRLAPNDRVQMAADGPGLAAPAAGAAWDAIDYTECCGGGGNVPPDPELAAGPNHVIAVVNVAFEIYSSSGVSQGGVRTFASFMGGNPNCTGVFDPNVLYDESTGRYILGIDADGVYYCVAVSQTGDPTGSWNIYAFQTGTSRDFFDYPHAGVGNDAIYMGGNIFNCSIFSCSFKEARVWAFDKAAMYAGQAAGMVTHSLGNSHDTPQPLNLHGWEQGTWPAGGPHYFFGETNYNGATYTVFSWNDPFGANTLATVGAVDLVAATGVSAGMPVSVPQLGGQTVQANDFRPQDFEYRNGSAWSVQTIGCNPGGGTVDCIRWAQVDPATATVLDAGVYASSGVYRFFGDLAVNHCDDVAVGYTKSSTAMYPAVWVTGRESTDPPGTLQAEVELKAGEITYTAFDSAPRRWGDYSEMTVAPDGLTFWYLGEYSKNTGTTNGRWGTYVGSFSYPNCSVGTPPPTPTPDPTVTPDPTATPEPTPVPTGAMHVGDLDGAAVLGARGKWDATVTITVHDDGDNPVAGATVSGSWSGGASGRASCITDGSGQCSVVKSNIKASSTSVTLTVTNVSDGTHTYDAGANHDPDGDSNGTAITVLKP